MISRPNMTKGHTNEKTKEMGTVMSVHRALSQNDLRPHMTKPAKSPVRPAKAQISLDIRPV